MSLSIIKETVTYENKFDEFKDFGAIMSQTFNFWKQYLNMVNIMLNYLRVEGIASWGATLRSCHISLRMTVQIIPGGQLCQPYKHEES